MTTKPMTSDAAGEDDQKYHLLVLCPACQS